MRQLKPKDLRSQLGEWANTPLYNEFNKDYLRYLRKYIKKRRKESTVYPDSEDVFKAFRLCSPSDLKVVILGQGPYHDGSADGLAFSNGGNYNNISPSLRNIFKEIENDIGMQNVAPDPDLSRWAEQGVLLLNTCLTVEKGESGSHLRIPCPDGEKRELWQRFTRKAIKLCSDIDKPTVFMLWGNYAKSYVEDTLPVIDPLKPGNRVLRAYHPIAESYGHSGFYNQNHFSQCNQFLKDKDIEPIQWQM